MKFLQRKTINILTLAMTMTFLAGCGVKSIPQSVNDVDAKWAEVQNQYQRRMDLIPNLVNTVKGYATHESAAFENVTKARAAAMGVQGANPDHAEAENMLTGALKSIFAVAEAYPDLKANANFLKLQDELASTENQILTSRTRFNEAVKPYNNHVLTFPNSLFAGMFGFKEKAYFEATEGAEKPVEVKF